MAVICGSFVSLLIDFINLVNWSVFSKSNSVCAWYIVCELQGLVSCDYLFCSFNILFSGVFVCMEINNGDSF